MAMLIKMLRFGNVFHHFQRVLLLAMALLGFYYFSVYVSLDTRLAGHHVAMVAQQEVGGLDNRKTRHELLHIRNQIHQLRGEEEMNIETNIEKANQGKAIIHKRPKIPTKAVAKAIQKKVVYRNRTVQGSSPLERHRIQGLMHGALEDNRVSLENEHYRSYKLRRESQMTDLVEFQISGQSQRPPPRAARGPYHLYVESVGRYGNNLFQLASAYGIARASQHHLVVTPALWQALFIFVRSNISVGDKPANISAVTEEFAGKYEENLWQAVPKADAVICCYLQSYKYFLPSADDVRNLFTLNSVWAGVAQRVLVKASHKYLHALRKRHGKTGNQKVTLPENITYVGVHIRRQDVSDPTAQYQGFKPAPLSYVVKAMDYYRHNYTNVMFLVLTDDIEWCREYLSYRKDLQIVSGSDYMEFYQDFAVLLQCNHTIITVGTFGWFAGWLAGGEVVYYKNWPEPFTKISEQYSHEDYFPSDWIGIGD